ncbi:MAG: hypothetical protein Q3M24_17585 [Candidatus Electrothrix aestuarii]|uniref:Uncharacterized protein n=1 Tax=Candidatus Electrothrix aestuarii TaxID=3062594 RepID=A0AAU8LSJ7_9BACT
MIERNSRLLLLAIFINLLFGNLIVFRVILQPNFPALDFSAHHIFAMMMKLIPISLISIWLLINNARYFLKEQDRMKRIIRSMIIAYAIPISCFWFLIFIIVIGGSGESDKILLTAFIVSGLFASIGSIFWGPFALINYLIFSKLVLSKVLNLGLAAL